ncbi:MAG: hypothetical protein Q9184_004827 [Pyrenodesmia sp. 2 TL-2023]
MLQSPAQANPPGFPLNYGVFQNYYYKHEPYAGNTNMSTIGTLGTAFYFLGAPIATYLVQRYARWQRQTIWIGFTIAIVGLGAAGWAKDFGSLVATQGIIFGMGVLIMWYPIFNMMNEWFVERRGFALAVICASTGFTGLFYPFALEVLLNKYGPETTLRISAVGLLSLCGPCLPLFKNRCPISRNEAPETDHAFLKMPLFYCFALAGLLQGLGFYFPTIYLSSYATSLGLNSTMGALLLVIYSLAQIVGQMAFGYVSDMRIKRLWQDQRAPVEILVFLSPFISGVAILVLWGPAHSLGMLIAFAIVYGISAGGFAVLWVRMVRFTCITLPPHLQPFESPVRTSDFLYPSPISVSTEPSTQASTLSTSPTLALTTFSYFACMKGIGNVVTGPISSALISLSPDVGHDVYATGRFKGIVAYSCACMLASAAVMVVWWVGKRVRECVGRRDGSGKGNELPA